MFPQESPQDSAITRDINRTFPAHDYFKDTGGDGQDSLYKICKVFHMKTKKTQFFVLIFGCVGSSLLRTGFL